MKISACIITKNEAKNIKRSIESYINIVDEIIVVDSGSTDDTVTIALSLGAEVFSREWNDDFSAAKNYAIDKATGDFIIFLDGDEYFAEGHDKLALAAIRRAQKEGQDFILSPRHELHGENRQVMGVCYVERIFRREAGIRYVNRIHEYLKNANGSFRRLYTDEFIIYHTGYTPELVKEKLERNLAILLEWKPNLEERHMRHLYLAEVYAGLSRHEDVIREADKLMALPEFPVALAEGQKIFRIYIFKISAMIALADVYKTEEIEKLVKEAVGKFGGHPEIKAIQSYFYKTCDHIDEAICAYEEALNLSEGFSSDKYDNAFTGNQSEKFLYLARLYIYKDDVQKAAEYLFAALQADTGNDAALFDLFVLLRHLLPEEKQEVIEGLYDTNKIDDITRIIKAACMAGENELFLIYIVKLSKQWSIDIRADLAVYCRILLLQREYDELLEITGGHLQEGVFKRFDWIARLLKEYDSRMSNDTCGFIFECDSLLPEPAGGLTFEFYHGIIVDLLTLGADAQIKALKSGGLESKVIDMESHDNQSALAHTFEKYHRWENACDWWLKCQYFEKAAHAAYCSGDYERARHILEEGASFIPRGSFLPEQLCRWMGVSINL